MDSVATIRAGEHKTHGGQGQGKNRNGQTEDSPLKTRHYEGKLY